MIGVIFVICFVPETKGRDLDSIAKLFLKTNKKSKESGDSEKNAQKCQEKCDVALSSL